MMTRSQLRRFLFEAIGLFVFSMAFILISFVRSSSNADIRRQQQLVTRFAPVMQASEFTEITGSVFKSYPDINSVYIGYGENSEPIGYVIDISSEAEDATSLHLLIGIGYENAEITGIARVGDNDDTYAVSAEDFKMISDDLVGTQIPIAFKDESVTDDSELTDSQVINGLNDGTYYAQSLTADKNGYIDYVELKVEGGEISNVQWDAFNLDPTTENRSRASLSGAYEVSGDDWATQSYTVCHALLEVQNPDDLAMKSDGTTEIVTGVTCDIRPFVELANECIDNSRNSYDMDKYFADMSRLIEHIFGVSAEDKDLVNNDGFIVYSFDKYPELYSVYTAGSDPEVVDTLTLREIMADIDAGTTPGTASEVTPEVTSGATPEAAAETTDSSVTSADGDNTVNGAEDGYVESDDEDDSVLSDSIDDLPMSEIASYITPVANAPAQTRQVVHMCNTCYKFLKDYLNWLV